MAILYRVKVDSIDLEAKTVIVNIETFHPDAMNFSENLGFAMNILHDSARSKSTLSKFMDHESTMSKSWVQKNLKGFISNSKLLEVRAPEPQELVDNGSYLYWHGEGSQANAKLRITVTNEAWIAHLSVSSQWGSTAFDVPVDYEECAPVNPNQEENSFSTDYENSGGWILVNGAAIEGYSPTWPTLYIPKYSKKSYRRIEKISYKNLTTEVIDRLLFKTVFILDRSGNKSFGTIIPYGEDFGLLYIKNQDEVSFLLREKESVLNIGLAEFNINDPAKVEIY